MENDLFQLTADTDRSIRETAQESLQRVRARATQHLRRRNAASWRHPIDSVRRYITGKLELDGLRQMWLEERLASTPNPEIIWKIQTKIFSDAELARRYRVVIRLIYAVVEIALVGGVLLVLFLRLSLRATQGLLGLWPFVLGLTVVVGFTLLPVARGLRDRIAIRVMQGAVATVLVIAALGGIVYTWWIWMLLAALAGAFLTARTVRQRARRREQVSAALNSAVVPFVA